MTSLIEANFTVNMQCAANFLNSAGDKPDRLNRRFTVKCLLIGITQNFSRKADYYPRLKVRRGLHSSQLTEITIKPLPCNGSMAGTAAFEHGLFYRCNF